MTDLSLSLRWYPRFSPITLAPDQLLLLSEQEPLFLTGPQYEPLIQGIQSSLSIDAILAGIPQFSQQVTLLHLIEQGFEQNLWITSDLQESPIYQLPDFSLAPLRLEKQHSQGEGWVLSQYGDCEFWEEQLQKLPLPVSVPIVVVDDYLDPRLVVINAHYLHQQQPWLLLKATGQQPWFGPHFTPNVPHTPCWQCLANRLSINQPVRRWWQLQSSGSLPAVPILFETSRVQAFFDTLKQQPSSFWKTPLTQLWEVKKLDSSMIPHPVQYRPQCPACGHSNWMVEQQSTPWLWEETPKIYTDDGGFRSCSPQATYQAVQASLDPISGVVLYLRPTPVREEGSLVTFSSAFFKTPQGKRLQETIPKNFLGAQDFMQISLGKGVSEAQSQASALAESIERYASQYQGDEQKQRALPVELGNRVILPAQLTMFSERQYQQFEEDFVAQRLSSHAVTPYSENQPLHWIPAWSFTHQEWCQVPFTYCYANTPLDDERFIRFHSNGCAAGNTLEEAALQGFLEVVERDATAIWWYNRVVRPAVDLSRLPAEAQRRIEQSIGHSWDYWVLDLTHDLPIPVMAAVAQHRDNQTFCFGFGCHLDGQLACLRALTELCQLIAMDNQFAGEFDFRNIPAELYLFPDPASSQVSLLSSPVHPTLKEDLETCIDRTQRVGLEVLVVNTSRPDLPLKTVKVIVPGLANIWPQLGNARLYEVPVQCDWRETALTESQLNPMGLFV